MVVRETFASWGSDTQGKHGFARLGLGLAYEQRFYKHPVALGRHIGGHYARTTDACNACSISKRDGVSDIDVAEDTFKAFAKAKTTDKDG